ncbi:MAG: acetyl-CoA C-acyltransferase [Deltaproteobacteria bacterium]|nr:MAG: acetyl-CoA C-acyltransferase [Deltaproteobacteria bacterium]
MSKAAKDIVIVSGCRTAIGKFGGTIKDFRAHQLGGIVMNEAIKRAGIDKGMVDEIVMGDCVQCPDEANTARTAALTAGFPVEVPAYTIQKQCSSSMQALASARQQIIADDAEIMLVVGTESMSNAPYVLPEARWGQRLMDGKLVDALWEMLHSGSTFLKERMIMGQTAEKLATIHSITREEQDEIAFRSHLNAEAATNSGKFADEIVPVTVKTRKGEIVFDKDEHIRFGIKMDDLSRLKPTFIRDSGTVTAGNSSGLNDGAAAAVIMTRAKAEELGVRPLAKIVGITSAGVDPTIMGYGPVPAIEKLLKKTGRKLEEVGLLEVNEAFAAQYIACEKALNLNREITNVNGSGIGLGHPVGCTGLRIVISLMNEMIRRGEMYGIASLCVGGGMGLATLLELED